MKKLVITLAIVSFMLITALFPVKFLGAIPLNLITNGDFETGDYTGWDKLFTTSIITESNGNHYAQIGVSHPPANITQTINASNLNLNFSYKIKVEGPYPAGVVVLQLYSQGNPLLPELMDIFNTTADWNTINHNVLEWWGVDVPTFDQINLRFSANDSLVSFDDIVLSAVVDEVSPAPAAPVSPAAPVWIRTMPMTCYRVWVNEDNKFQFVFWYPYRDNNWVKIYDMSGKMVYEIDMPYDNPNLIVDLPDGMYTVKTFTVGSTEPIQTFVIGKP